MREASQRSRLLTGGAPSPLRLAANAAPRFPLPQCRHLRLSFRPRLFKCKRFVVQVCLLESTHSSSVASKEAEADSRCQLLPR